MSSFGIVKFDVFLYHFIQVKPSVGRVKVYLFILDRLPEAFDVDVVQCPSLTVHQYWDLMALEHFDILGARILGPLIGVVYLQCAMVCDGILQ